MEHVNTPGLTKEEAAARLRQYGLNQVPSAKGRTIFTLVIEVFKEPMFLLLVGCVVIYLFVGEVSEALLLLSFVVLMMGITFYQERKTDKAIESLRNLSAPWATVIRDGQTSRVPGAEVVPGDAILLSEGERVCADAVLIETTNLATDESLLTGESLPVHKSPASDLPRRCDLDMRALAQGHNEYFAFSGTLVVAGQGVGIVSATGNQTELGQIGVSLESVRTESTLLESETRHLVRILATLGLLLCAFTAAVYAVFYHDVTQGLLSGLTLAMAVIPEELPVVYTLFLTLGAWRMSLKNVLARRPPTIEMLGAATVLCSDKTGTMTQNQMTVVRLVSRDNRSDLSSDDARSNDFVHASNLSIVEFANLASSPAPHDPMEKAILLLGQQRGLDIEHHFGWRLVKNYPLSQDLLAVTQVWQSASEHEYAIASKGAPEAILQLCRLPMSEQKLVMHEAERMAEDGIRVLGVARAVKPRTADVVALTPWDFPFEFIGLLGLRDPVRPGVPDAVKRCQSAGIRVIMITGDHPVTAQSIAREVGLKSTDKVVTGQDLNSMSDSDLEQMVGEVDVFARIVPEQKLRLVRALKAHRDVVAMTGDGVNDAPALKAAHIGVAMGKRGTDVAREAGSLVLLDDDFSSIVSGIELGRRIYDNLMKAFAYTFAVHIPIIGLSVLPILFQTPLVLFPAHVVFMELIIDPACSVVFEVEPAEQNAMRRPPRDPQKRLINVRTLALSVFQGFSVLLAALLIYAWAIWSGYESPVVRGLTLVTVIVGNVFLILVNRSWTKTLVGSFQIPNPFIWWLMSGAIALLLMVLYIPFFQRLFQVSGPSIGALLLAVFAGAVCTLWFDMAKIRWRLL